MMPVIEDFLASFNLQSVLLIGLLLLFTIRYIFSYPKNLPPGPQGYPIIGILPKLGKEPYLAFSNWAKEYGNIYSVSIGGKNVVVLNDMEIANEAFVANAKYCSDRPALPDLKNGLGIPGSLVFENGPVWKKRRIWALGAFRNFGVGKRSLENRINVEANYMCQEIEKKSSTSEVFDPRHFLSNAVSNIICSISFGERFEYSDSKFEFLLKCLQTFFVTLSQVSPSNFFPFLWYTPYRSEIRKIISAIRGFISNIVEEHRQTFDSENIRDMIDHYLDEINHQKAKEQEVVFDTNSIPRGIQDLFQAGTETTSTTMSWALLYLTNFPEVQKRAQMEVENVFGKDRPPSWAERNELPFVRAFIMEVQRHATITHLNVPRCTNAEIKLKGYTIPENTRLILNSWNIHRHPKYWEDPDKFDPMRHIEDDGKTIKQNDAFIPYGIGDRICLGQLLAKMELFLLTVNILQRFTFKVPDSESPPSLTDVSVGIIRAPKPFCLSVDKF